MANLRDVANLAGVDPSTASRVLRGDPAQHVRPDTRQRILDAARELSYRPNALARSLRTRRTGTIGLLVPSLDNVGFAETIHGIQQAAAAGGRLLLVVEAQALADDDEAAEEVYERLVGDGLVDGLIVAFATLQDHHVSRLADQGIPLVLVNRRTDGVSGSVVVDDQEGSRMAVRYLIELGHRAIGYVGLPGDTDTARRRREGYREAMEAGGLGVEPRWLQARPPTVEAGREGIEALLDANGPERPTAVFVASLMSALGVRAGLMARGLRIPADVSLIAFNDHPIAEHLDPPLTTVRMPSLRMGHMAVERLLRAIDGEPVGDLMIDEAPRIIVRASTAAVTPAGSLTMARPA